MGGMQPMHGAKLSRDPNGDGWLLDWPTPTWRLCKGCKGGCPGGANADRPRTPCRLRVCKDRVASRHEDYADAQALAKRLGMGPLVVEG